MADIISNLLFKLAILFTGLFVVSQNGGTLNYCLGKLVLNNGIYCPMIGCAKVQAGWKVLSVMKITNRFGNILLAKKAWGSHRENTDDKDNKAMVVTLDALVRIPVVTLLVQAFWGCMLGLQTPHYYHFIDNLYYWWVWCISLGRFMSGAQFRSEVVFGDS